jgi:hypothetical protein
MPALPFYGGWLLIHLIGGAAAGILTTRFQFLGDLILAGLPLALVQTLFLYNKVNRPWLWLLTLALGWPLAHLLYATSNSWLTPLVDALTTLPFLWEVFWINVVRLGLVLVLIGGAQWLLVLRPLAGSGRWILVSGLGGAVVGGISATVCRAACDPLAGAGGSLLVGATLGMAGWAGYALVTGPFLAQWLSPTRSTIRESH